MWCVELWVKDANGVWEEESVFACVDEKHAHEYARQMSEYVEGFMRVVHNGKRITTFSGGRIAA